MTAASYNAAIYSIAQEMLDGEDVDGRISSLASCTGMEVSNITYSVSEAADNLRD